MIKILDKKATYTIADYNTIDNIKSLSLDISYNLNKDFSYYNYSCSYFLYVLYTKYLNHDINDKSWINKDKFITNLDINPLINSILFMCNFISLEDLKQKKLEYEKHNLSYAVGCCLKEKYLNEKYLINKKNSLISYYTYFLCNIDSLSNKDYEAISYIGLNKLNKLIIFCIEDHEAKKTKELFKLYGYNVNDVSFDDLELLDVTIEKCKKSLKPSIIFLNTNKEQEVIKLDKEIIKQMKEKLGIRDIPFTIYNENKNYIDSLTIKNSKIISDWHKKYDKYQDKFNIEDNTNNEYSDEKEFIKDKLNKSFIVSCKSNNYLDSIICKNKKYYNFSSFKSLVGDISYSLSDNDDVVVITSINDVDYLLENIKNACINDRKILYLIENKSYQDEEFNKLFMNISILKTIPKLVVYTPCDEKEFIGSYLSFINHNDTSVIIIPSEFKEINKTKIKEVDNGCYILKKEKKPRGNIIVTGSEIPIALDVYKKLKSIGIFVNVLSMPSKERFLLTDIKYRQKILQDLPTAVIDFSSNNSWYNLGFNDKEICGINKYYYNDSSETKEKYYKITVEDIYNKVKKLFN